MTLKQIKPVNTVRRFNFKLKRDHKIYIVIAISITIFFILLKGFISINNWYDKHYFVFKSPVELVFNRPLTIKERIVQITEIINVIEQVPELEDLSPIEEYICEKWGVYDCKTALAVAKSESGMREQAVGINTNGTIDVGIFQINTVHFGKEGCSLKDLVDAHKNIDCAYNIWQDQGWTPWVAFNTGKFKAHLDE